MRKSDHSNRNRFADFFHKSWIQTAGEGWTRQQISVSYVYSIVFAIIIIFYSFFSDLNWNWAQMLATFMIAWDLGGGVLGYNHRAIKVRQSKETGRFHFFHHNLQHIHPLLLIFFQNKTVLLILLGYWFLTFLLYVEFLEITTDTGKRKLSRTGEKIVIGFEIVIAVMVTILSFTLDNLSSEYRIFGLICYWALPVLTLLLINTTSAFQRTTSIMMVVSMILIGMFITIPEGYLWFIPVYYLKLLTGFTAKEEITEL